MITFQEFFVKKVEQYKNIAIFFHEIPDMDALGSAFALKTFIKMKYPEKDVRIIGLDILDETYANDLFYFDREHVPNSFLIESLGIIVDTSTSVRIWSQRQNFCRELCRIDHHPKIESLADYEWVDDNYPAASQMVAELLLDWDKNYMTSLTCSYLYSGIITDTGRFLYSSVVPSTYEITSELIKIGCDREKIHKIVYSKTIDNALFSSYILKKAHFNTKIGFAWVKVPKNSFDKFGIKLRLSMVHVLNNFKNISVWMSFYYDNIAKEWKGSIRSDTYQINEIAKKYNGGGHRLAAGFSIKKRSDFKNIVNDIRNMLLQKK